MDSLSSLVLQNKLIPTPCLQSEQFAWPTSYSPLTRGNKTVCKKKLRTHVTTGAAQSEAREELILNQKARQTFLLTPFFCLIKTSLKLSLSLSLCFTLFTASFKDTLSSPATTAKAYWEFISSFL